ncbi:hypothetical protein F5Y06DRAFT_273357 [Hypoxylon sp. FL0890]|nr:hypothetical protein F5Y06DRAFT_273357 [Hypoxylon sp. FL0890]
MDYQKMLLVLFTLIAAAWATASPMLFRGTSIVTLPDETSSLNSNTTLAASFFCYMTEKGYFSFGWWTLPSSLGNTSQCQPDSDSFHWVELAQKISCNEETETCLYRMQHISMREPDDEGLAPFWDGSLEYVIQSQASKKGDGEEIALTYIDGEGAKFDGVGTKQMLSGEPRMAGECQKALRTLKQTYERLDIDLGFEIGDPCTHDTTMGDDWVSEL